MSKMMWRMRIVECIIAYVLVGLLFVAFPGMKVVRLARYARTMVKVIGRRPQTDAARNHIDLEFEGLELHALDSIRCPGWLHM